MFLTAYQQLQLLSQQIHCDPQLGYGTVDEQIHNLAEKYFWDEETEALASSGIHIILQEPVKNMETGEQVEDLVVGSFQP